MFRTWFLLAFFSCPVTLQIHSPIRIVKHLILFYMSSLVPQKTYFSFFWQLSIVVIVFHLSLITMSSSGFTFALQSQEITFSVQESNLTLVSFLYQSCCGNLSDPPKQMIFFFRCSNLFAFVVFSNFVDKYLEIRKFLREIVCYFMHQISKKCNNNAACVVF